MILNKIKLSYLKNIVNYVLLTNVIQGITFLILASYINVPGKESEAKIWLFFLIVNSLYQITDFGICPPLSRLLAKYQEDSLLRLYSERVSEILSICSALLTGALIYICLKAYALNFREILIFSGLGVFGNYFFARAKNLQAQFFGLRKENTYFRLNFIFAFVTSGLYLLSIILDTSIYVFIAIMQLSHFMTFLRMRFVLKKENLTGIASDTKTRYWNFIRKPALNGWIGLLLGIGVVNASQLIMQSKMLDVSFVGFLFALRSAQMLDALAMSGFTVNLPNLNKLRTDRRMEEFKKIVKRSFFSCLILLALGFLTFYLLIIIIGYFGTDINFVDYKIWAFLFLMIAAHRLAGLFMHVHSTSNDEPWVPILVVNAVFTLLIVYKMIQTQSEVLYLASMSTFYLIILLPYTIKKYRNNLSVR